MPLQLHLSSTVLPTLRIMLCGMALLSVDAIATDSLSRTKLPRLDVTDAAASKASVKQALAPYHRAMNPITDAEGRTRVIIDFKENAKERYYNEARVALSQFDPKRDRHHPQALLLLDAKSRQYGIKPEFGINDAGQQVRTNVTTWTGVGLTAFLSSKQIEQLRQDEDVRLVSDDRPVQLASNPPWAPSWNGAPWTEINDWGWHAVRGKTVTPGSTRVVWIIDSGVAHHTDLTSVTQRLHIDSASGAITSSGPLTVGCYSHGTHVAGIIGAASNNGIGRRGIYAGVQMRSITSGFLFGDCVSQGNALLASHVAAALDYIYNESMINPMLTPVRPNVVNFSSVFAETGFVLPYGETVPVPGINQGRIKKLVEPKADPIPGRADVYYPGNVFVQSAGNQMEDACTETQTTPNNPDPLATRESSVYKPSATGSAVPNDGVLVVGAVNSSGFRATSFAPTYPGGIATSGQGSNVGPCVDLWAPGDAIYSLWGQGGSDTVHNRTYGSGVGYDMPMQPEMCASGTCQSPPHSGWARLSGTSMAAPHVAAAAAYYIDQYGLTTPGQVEEMLRSTAQRVPSVWRGVLMVKLPAN